MHHTPIRLLLCVLAALSFACGPALAAEKPAEKPNILFIMADDLGWTDLDCYGSDLYETPHLDQLAKHGLRFTQAYSACTVCSPTRGFDDRQIPGAAASHGLESWADAGQSEAARA